MRPQNAVPAPLPSLTLVSHHTRLLARILLLLLIALIVATGSPLSAQTTFTVTNANDGGTGSLRQAMIDASSCFVSAGCYIAFNLGAVPPAGYHTIALASALPSVYRMNTHVDGTTQPGYAGIPVVVIDGSAAGSATDGLTVDTFSTGDGMGILVSGLGIQNFSGAAIRTRSGFTAPDVTITGNYIGISPDGTPAPNGAGIAIDSANWSTIGQNRIAYNLGDAITVASLASGIHIGPNSIYANGFGIDLLGTDGPTANDAGDGDTGGNTLTNFPLVTGLSFDGTTTTVSGTLAGASSSMYDIDLYENYSADPSGYGQGETWVGEALEVATDVSGNATFSIVISGDHTDMHFTATATWNEGSVGPWHTSEFSPAFAASDLSITKTDGVTSLPTGGVTTYTIEAHNSGPGGVTGATIDDTITSLFSAASWTCSASAGSSVAPTTGTGSISATADIAADGVITCLLTATLDPLTTGSITNIATITAPVGAVDPVLTNNSASDTNTIDPLPAADLAITKDDGVTTVIAGDAVTYTIVVSNIGPNPVTGASISDTPPPELINVTWTCTPSGGAVCVASAGTGSISTTGDISVGGSLTYTLQATVDPTLMGGSIVNSAAVSVPSGMLDPNSANDMAFDVDSLTASADLQVAIADSPDPVAAGGTISYTITATNAGPSDATFISITLTFDAALTGTSIGPLPGGWSCSGSAPIFTCSASTFPVGTVAFTASATAPAAAGTYTTTASIIASMPPDPVPGNDSASAITTVSAEADLGISKTDGVTSLIAGNDTTYTITVFNNGPSDVTGAVVTDTLPAALTNASWTCTATAGSACGAASGVGSIATTADVAYLGSVTYTLGATLDAAATGTVSNTVSVASSTVADPVSTNNSATDSDSITPQADLAVAITDSPDPVGAAYPLTYTITATNAGPGDATFVSITLTFDAALTSTSIGTLPSGWSCSGSAPIFTCSASTFPVGSVAFTAAATAPVAPGTYTTTASIIASMPPDPVPGNDNASAITTVTAEADLGISKTDGVTSLIPGNDTTYTITVFNSGPSDVTGAVVTDTLPAALTNVSWTCAATAGSACGAASGVGSIATTADVAYFGSVTFTLTATLDAAATGTVSNTASVTSSTVADPVSTNNSATDSDSITGQADLAVEITDSPDPVVAASPLTYAITVTNNGPSAAQGVTLTLDPDAALTAVAITPPAGWSCSGTAPVQCTTANLLAGSAVFAISATAPAEGGTSQSTVSVTGTTADPIPSNNGPVAAITQVTSTANISVTKTDGVTSIAPGAAVTYTITVGNAGPSFASGVVVADAIVAPLSGASWTCSATAGSACGAAAGTGSLSTTAGVAAGGTVTYLLTATLDAAATGSVTNTASVSSTIIDPVPTNNTASDTDTILSAIADLRICRTSGTVVVTGTSLTYTLVASNGGPSDVSGARLMDIVTIVPFGSEPALVGKSGTRIAPRLAGATWTCTASPGSSCGAASGTGDVDVLLDLVAGGSATVLVTVPIGADASGLISLNTAVTPPSGVTDTTPGNNAIRLNIPIRQKADLAIVKGHTGTPSAGDTVTYTIIASNLGPGTANGARVTDFLPPELTVVSWTCTASAGATCSTSSGAGDIDTLVDLPPGSQAMFSLSAVVSDTATGSVTNSASITSPFSTSDANLENNYAADPLGVAPCLLAPQPLAPVEEVLTDVTDVTFEWSDVGAASYEVFVSVNGGAFITAGTASTASLTLPVTSGEVRWYVVATDGACSITGPIAAFTVESCLEPATPVPSLVGQVNSGEPYTFSWTTGDADVVFEYRESPLESFDGASWTSSNERSITRAYTNNSASPAALWYQVRAWRSCPNGSVPSNESIPVRVAVSPANASSDSATVQEGDDNPVSQLMRICLNAQNQVVACGAGLQSASGIVPFDTPVTIGTDRPWMTVTPSSTNIPPGGTLVTVTASPLGLPTGTNTGSVVVTQSNGQVSNVPFSLNIVSPVTPVAKTPPPADALIIPAVAHADGAGSSWQSDVRLTNTSLQKVAYELAFTPSGADGSLTSKKTTIELAAGETKAFDDIVRQWFGNGALSDGTNGVLDIRPASGPKSTEASGLLASSRTYNATSNGTYGQWIPAVPFSRFVGRGTGGAPAALSMQQITQSSRYRTNLGLVEGAGSPAIVRVTIFDAHGVSLESFDVNLGAMEHRQINSVLASRNITLENGRIETRVVSGEGRITAYASVIDTVTNDPILVPGTETSLVKSSRFVMPGVADLDTGRNQWRTDLRVFNPSDRPVAISLVFYEQNESSNRREAQLTVEPGNVAVVDDTLETLFGVSNVGGAIHFLTSSEEPLIITGRTFDQQAAGTYGQFIPAVTPADAVGVDDRALEIQQLEQSDRYRTNVGIAEVTGNDVEVELTAIVPGSTVAPKMRVKLDPSEFTQLNGVLQQMGLGNAYNARMSVKVIGGGGRVSAYGSIIDQKTHDPTYVPGQ